MKSVGQTGEMGTILHYITFRKGKSTVWAVFSPNAWRGLLVSERFGLKIAEVIEKVKSCGDGQLEPDIY